jgi:CHAD domain-containing protein
MAFRLEHRRSARRELRRLVRKELDDAIERLNSAEPDESAVHDARTSIKKVRALVRLAREALGSSFGRQNARLRDGAHRLSALRDVDATAETLRALRGHYASVVTEAMIARVLRAQRAPAARVEGHAATDLTRTRRLLERARASLPERFDAIEGFDVVRNGVEEGYRRASRAFADLKSATDAAHFHVWRRRVKDHWYHVRLFERLHPAARRRAVQLDRLGTLLGDEHNLTILRTLLLDRSAQIGHARTVAILLGCIVKYQTRLRTRALTVGRRLFVAKPADIGDDITQWWRAGAHVRR